MTALALLSRIRETGCDLDIKHGKVVISGASRLPAELIAEAREHRAEIMSMLAGQRSNLVLEATERAAIIAESQNGNAAAPVPHRLPPSWADASIMPTAGARCHCCKGSRWWCEAVNPSGWRCSICHPPDHLQAGQFRLVATDG